MTERFDLHAPFALADLGLGDGAGRVTGVALLGHGVAGDLCFCDRIPSDDLKIPEGAIVLCKDELVALLGERYPYVSFVPLADPRAAFIDIGHRFLAEKRVGVSSMLPRPFEIHSSVEIGAQSVIDPEVRIDEGVKIGAHCVIHRGTWLQAGAVVRDHTVIGVAGINAYRGLDGKQRGFPHFASVVVGRNVEIGAGAVLVRGILNSTRIGHESVIGNLCNIGHGVDIGQNVWMSVGCLIGGHSRIGDRATLGMGVAVRDNIEIGAEVQAGMGSVVVKPVAAGLSVFGNPARVIPAVQAGPSR